MNEPLQNSFTQASSALSSEDKMKISDALTRYLSISPEDRDNLIKNIEETGKFSFFGYGSLMGDPASKHDEEFRGVLKGWERGAFCMDRYYRGTPDDLGVTMGALPRKNADTYGLVQVIDGTAGSGDIKFADRILKSIYEFGKRETSLNPIYQYKLVDIKNEDRGALKALICAANPDNTLFLGGGQPVMLPDGTVEGLSAEEAAALIAVSKGEPGASVRNTGIAYWQFVLDCTYKAGLAPEPHIKELVAKANYFRSLLPEEERKELERLDNLGDQAEIRNNYDARVFEVLKDQDPERGHILIQHARNELKRISGRKDPLTSAEIDKLKQQKKELEELVP